MIKRILNGQTVVEPGNIATEWAPDHMDFFDCLEGFRAKQVLEKTGEKQVIKYENNKDEERIVTLTKDEICIKWSAKD